MADKISEYYEVTVKCQEETGYNQKKQEPIYKKFSETYLVHTGSPEDASKIVEKKMEVCTWEWRVYNIKESKIVDVYE